MTATERMYYEIKKQNKKGSDLCRYLGISTSVLAGWKKQNTIPPAGYLVKISEFLNISIDYLLTGHERELPPEAQLTEGYNLNGDKITFSEEESNRLRILINEELNKQVEVAVRKVLQSEPQKGNKKED